MTLGEIAEVINGEVRGDPGIVVTGISEIGDAAPQHLVFAMDSKHARAAFRSRAGAVVLKRGLEGVGREGGVTTSWAGPGSSEAGAGPSGAGVKPPGAGAKACILVEEPRLALAAVLEILGPKPYMPPGVDPTARIAESARVSPDARIGAYAVVEPGAVIGPSCVLFHGVYVGFEAEIGEGTVLYPNVVIGERVKVGSRVIIHAGAVIGADGFGFVRDGNIHRKIPQVGTVVIEDDVEIGANTCIDRATLGQTVIGRGTKIDNLVQIGHNVRVGRNCIIVGQTGVGGSAIIEDGAVLAGQAGIVDHVTVGSGSTVAAGSLVTTNVRPGEIVSGRPAKPHVDELRAEIARRKLPDLMRSLLDLQETVRSLEKIVQEISAR